MLEGINHLAKIIQREGILNSSRITDVQKKAVKEKISSLHLNFYLYHNSLDIWQGKVYFLIEEEKEKKLVSFVSRKDNDDRFIADEILSLDGFRVKICSLRHENALAIREIFTYTAPGVLGTQPAFGTGDRIGGRVSATPGHIRALKDYNVAAFFTQQSVRENARTKRTFEQVLDDATWGVFQEGYKDRWGAQEVTDKLKKHFGVEEDLDLWKKLGIDKIIVLASRYIGPPLVDNKDVWGVKYKPKSYADGSGVYQEMCYNPLADMETIEEIEANYTFPKADWFDFSTVEKECRKYPEYAIECGYAAPFLMYNNIRGLEKSLMDLATNKEYAHYVIDRICDFLYSFHERSFEAGNGLIDIAHVTDDFGTQSGLMISTEMFDEFFKPHFQRLIKLVKDFGIKVFHHDCGAIRPIIPKMIELGIDILNPIQWRLPGMDPEGLKKDFGKALCFHGGVDNQKTLPFGNARDVEKEVIYLLETLASDKTGYILAPCHDIQPITPVENIIAMYETVHHSGRVYRCKL